MEQLSKNFIRQQNSSSEKYSLSLKYVSIELNERPLASLYFDCPQNSFEEAVTRTLPKYVSNVSKIENDFSSWQTIYVSVEIIFHQS